MRAIRDKSPKMLPKMNSLQWDNWKMIWGNKWLHAKKVVTQWINGYVPKRMDQAPSMKNAAAITGWHNTFEFSMENVSETILALVNI